MRFAYVGFTTDVLDGWERFAPEPKAPSNWKDQSKIADYVREARDKQAAEAAVKPLTGRFRDIVVLNQKSDAPVQASWPDLPILDFLSQYERVACIDYSTFRSLALADYIDKKGALDDNAQWAVISARSGFPYLVPSTKWAAVPMLFDPLHAITGSSSEENTDPGSVLSRYKLPMPYGPDAGSKAAACKAVCKLLGC